MEHGPRYIDVHAHVNFNAYNEDRDAVIKRSLEAGVWMINVGTQQRTSQKAVELAQEYEAGVYAIVGLHPIHTDASYHDTDELGEEGKPFTSHGEVFDVTYYRDLLQQPRVVGIGECGLDYFRTSPDSLEKQKEAFVAQVELALETDVPLMIHTRPEKGSMQAYDDTLEILATYNKEHGEKLRGDFHFFAGDTTIARRVLDLGFMYSFTGVVTFTRDYDEIVRYVPLDAMLAETDCPYVTPEPYRGKRNEPQYVEHTVASLAEIKRTTLLDFQEQLLVNAQKLFALY